MPKDMYEVVAFHEGAAFDKVKNWAKDKSGYNQLYDAGLFKKYAEMSEDKEKEHRRKAAEYSSLRRKALEEHDKADDYIDRIGYSMEATNHMAHASDERSKANSFGISSDRYSRDSERLKDSGTASMRKVGRNTGGLGGAVLGAAAGKGYSVYKRHQMKKRGATKKELAEHKKGDLKRMIKGAGVGAAIGGVGGHVGGSHYAKAIYKRAYESEPLRVTYTPK